MIVIDNKLNMIAIHSKQVIFFQISSDAKGINFNEKLIRNTDADKQIIDIIKTALN